jgi:hypothetical protein
LKVASLSGSPRGFCGTLQNLVQLGHAMLCREPNDLKVHREIAVDENVEIVHNGIHGLLIGAKGREIEAFDIRRDTCDRLFDILEP